MAKTLTLIHPEIETYAAAHSEAPSPLLEALKEETRKVMGARAGMQVGRLEGDFLRLLVRLARARRVLEIGMFTGYSAICMAEGLPEDGELITCDIDPAAEAIARRYFAQLPAGRRIQVRMGPALETIRTLQAPFDLVFIDADKANYLAYYEACLPLVRPGGLIVADNTLWSGKVLGPESVDDHAIVAFNEKVAADPRVEKVLVTVRDGMMLAYKR